MAQVGTGKYTYELIRDFFKLPDGQSFGMISRVAADSQDRIYVFQRKDPPVVVFDSEGKYLGAWGSGEVTDPHGLKIVGDVVYTTDRSDSSPVRNLPATSGPGARLSSPPRARAVSAA